MRKGWIMAAALLLLAGMPAASQSRGEVSFYNRTLRKLTVKNANKFLEKYPASVYREEMTRLRDSLLFFGMDPENAAAVQSFVEKYPDSDYAERAYERIRRHNTSMLSHEEALAVAGSCLDAVGWRKDNVDHVIALDPDFRGRVLSLSGGVESTFGIPVYRLDERLTETSLVGPLEVVRLGRRQFYLHFACLNASEGAADKEYVEYLYDPSADVVQQAMFYGKALTPEKGEAFRIEGQSPEKMAGLQPSAETLWLLERMDRNSSLVPISEADLLTDNAIAWWRAKNPKAETTASKITFGTLDPESSLVARYKKAAKEKDTKYNAAFFSYRGWTVIVAASRAGGNYLLLWCEPACQNRYRGKVLSSIYFENDGNTLDMAYYKGKTFFKYKLSLAGGSLRR